MTLPNTSAVDEYTAPQQTQASAVSWAAIMVGAAGTALSLILLMLGTHFSSNKVSCGAYG
ncbi:MAG TPA: hypothetical protein VIF37_21100 [Methylobacter sp.]|jgi:hypothetical protein